MAQHIIAVIMQHITYRTIEADTIGEAFEMARNGDGREIADMHEVVGYSKVSKLPKRALTRLPKFLKKEE